jgi:hypothetical protein
VPDKESALRFRRLWPHSRTRKQERKTSPVENGHHGEAPKYIYHRAVRLELLVRCSHPFAWYALALPTTQTSAGAEVRPWTYRIAFDNANVVLTEKPSHGASIRESVGTEIKAQGASGI